MIKKYFTLKNSIAIFIALLAAYFLFPPNFQMVLYPLSYSIPESWLSLDPSWIITLNYANLKGLNWGTDFIFTNGPLSYLTTRVGWGANRFDFLIYDLFLFVNLFLLFFYTIKRAKSILFPVLLLVAACFILPNYLGPSNALLLLFILIFWIRKGMDDPKWIYFILQILVLSLLFYIKFNTGLISFILFYVGLGYCFFKTNYNKWFLTLIAFIPLILIFITAKLLKVDIINYAISGVNMVTGYNQTMYFDRPFCDLHLFSIILMILLNILFFVILKREWKQHLILNLVTFFMINAAVYVLFKQAFIRGDDGHILEFYTLFCILLFSSFDFIQKAVPKLVYPLVSVCIGICVYFVHFKNENHTDFKEKFFKPNYITGFKDYTPESGFKLFPNNNQLPSDIIARIGSQSVDIYPWNSYMLFENKLNFSPRPIFQSYAAYTAYLEQLNFDFYNSAKAPQFILYDYTSIDARYPLFDEAKLNLAILTNYQRITSFDYKGRKVILLEKRGDFRPIILKKDKEYAMYLGDPFVPKEGIFYEIGIYNSILGNIVSLVHHSPDLILTVASSDGNLVEYKTSIGLLESGVFLDKTINNTIDFENLFDPQKSETNKMVIFYKITPKSNSFFKDKIRITEYKISQ